jgi:hypothetical protein
MANILLTNKCVRACPYCFAKKEMGDSEEKDYMSWENVIYIADFLQAAGENRVSLLGGEPALHPEFIDMLLYLMDRGFNVTTFTSGIMPKAILNQVKKHISGYPSKQVNFVCNLNNPEQTKVQKSETERVQAFLSALGPWTMPGFNIYRLDFDLHFLFDLVDRYALKKNLRLGIAHPLPGSANEFIRVDEIDNVIERIYSYKSAFSRSNISLSFDCGFPLCRVTDEQLGWLARLTGRVNFKCLPAIDVTPDMYVYCCFPLSRLNRKSIFEFNSFNEVVDFYKKLQKRIRREIPGIYDECDNCVHRTVGICAGGGVCQLVKRLADEAPDSLLGIEDEHDKACLSERTHIA